MNIEERLRNTLIDERLALPAWPDPIARIQEARFRRYRRLRRILGGLVALVLATLLGGAIRTALVSGDQPGSNAVPWLDLPVTAPTEAASPTRPAAEACRAEDLAAEATVEGDGAGGHLRVGVTIRRTASATCTLSGSPSLKADSASVPTQSGTFFDGGNKQYPATTTGGEEVHLDIETSVNCPGTERVYRNLTVEAAGREYSLGDAVLDTTCPVKIGDWYYVPADNPPATIVFSPLSAEVHAPATVHKGQTIDYEVLLKNGSDQPVTFDSCPTYHQTLWKSGGYYQLNCQGVEIPAHGSVLFAMRLSLDPDAQSGNLVLQWQLYDGSDVVLTGNAPVEVAP